MQDKCVNILLAMPPQADEEVILEGIRRDLTDAGLTVGRLEMRSSNIRQYLELYADTDVVIIAEHQENRSYAPKELDELSICREGICLIPIIDESKGSSYVKQLEAYGIYTAVFENEHDYGTIARLVQSGRSKREARIYYGIEVPAAGTVQGGYDAANAVRYLVGSGDDYTELETRLGLLSERLGSTRKMLEVLGRLPEETLRLVSRMDQYRELCRLLSEEKEVFAAMETTESSPAPEQLVDMKDVRKGRHRKGPAEHRQTVDIGIVATNVGVGCTYCSIMLAHSLESRYHARVAVVEFDNRDAHFENLCQVTMGTLEVSGIRKFEIHGVDYYFDTSYSRFVTQHKLLYDYVVYDFGCADNAAIERYYLGLHHKFVVAGGADWRLGELEEFVFEVSKMDINNSLVYLIPLISKKDMGNLVRLVPENLAVPVRYEDNPYRPGRKTQHMFDQLLSGTWSKTYRGQEISIQQKSARKPAGQWYGICAILSLTIGILGGGTGTGLVCRQAYGKSMAVASGQVRELSDRLEASRQDVQQLKDEIGRNTVDTYALRSPVPAGTIITRDIVDPVTICSSLTASYIQEEDLGQVMARVDLVGNIPICRSDVEKKNMYPLPAAEAVTIDKAGGDGIAE